MVLLHLCHGPNFTGKSCNIEFDKISLRNSFQPDDGDDQSSDEEQSPECGWLVENKDANQYSANGTYPCPDWVSCAQWYCLGRFGQQRHTQNRESNKTSYPPTPFYPGNVFCTSETIGEAYFAKSCDNQDNPIHKLQCLLRAARLSRRLLLRRGKGIKLFLIAYLIPWDKNCYFSDSRNNLVIHILPNLLLLILWNGL